MSLRPRVCIIKKYHFEIHGCWQGFLRWFLIASWLCCQPIRSQVWKFLLTYRDLNALCKNDSRPHIQWLCPWYWGTNSYFECSTSVWNEPGAWLSIKMPSHGIGIPIIKIRQFHDCLIFIMGIPVYTWGDDRYVVTGSRVSIQWLLIPCLSWRRV